MEEGNVPPPKTSPQLCKFFTLGTCMWGPKCRNSHDLAESPAAGIDSESLAPGSEPPQFSSKGLDPNIRSFTPASVRVAEILSAAEIRPACHFYAKGTCKNGILCNFLHDGDDVPENKDPMSDGPFTKIFHGANVTFKAGAEISKVTLPSDHSTLQLTDLPSGAKASSVREILSIFGFDVPISSIRVKAMRHSGSLATVEFDDPDSAQRVLASIEEALDDGGDGTGELDAKVIQSAAKFGNRLRVTSVFCTWYRPCLTAKLIFRRKAPALDAKIYLQSESRGSLHASAPCFNKDSRLWEVSVKGLKPGTTETELGNRLLDYGIPDLILMGDLSYDVSDDDAAELVENVLRRCGQVDFYEWKVKAESNRLQAQASFKDRDAAVRAVAVLDKIVVPELGDVKLAVTRIISTKYNISSEVLNALEPKIQSWQARAAFPGVRIDLYKAAPPTIPFATIRVSGKEEKMVSQAKIYVEKAIAGTVVTDGEVALWDPWFRSYEGVTFLEMISELHNLYIHINIGKSNLILFGGNDTYCRIVTEQIVAKIRELGKTTHRIVLGKGMLSETIRGGMQKIRDRFGKAAHFNLSITPRTITIQGSEEDYLLAQSILQEGTDNDITLSEEDNCSICWCPADVPLITSCGHTYCTNCFYNAASSTTKQTFFVCNGQQGKCAHPFSIRELQDLLPFSRLETLLQDFFERYVSMHPEELQYCPMPDCHSLHHPSKTGLIATCHSCLNDICTSCNVVSHYPINCQDWRENHADGGTRAFERWKAENNAKDCPKCKTALMKSEGCNHIQCDGCEIHICWKCLETFATSDECYAHMTAKHDGFYDEAIYNDEETDTDDD